MHPRWAEPAGALEASTQVLVIQDERWAKGMIMHERHCTADEAFTILKTLSAHSNRKLRDVAQAILDNAHLTPRVRPRTPRRTTTP